MSKVMIWEVVPLGYDSEAGYAIVRPLDEAVMSHDGDVG